MSCHIAGLGKGLAGLIVVLLIMAVGRSQLKAQTKGMEPPGGKFGITEPMECIPGQVMVQVKPGTPEVEVQQLAAQLQAQVGPQIPEYCLYLFQLPPVEGEAAQAAQLQDAIKWLQAQPAVQAAHPNYKLSIPRPVEIPPKLK